MRCLHTNFSIKPPTPCPSPVIPTKKPTSLISFSLLSQPKALKTQILALSSFSTNQKTQEDSISSTTNVEFKTMGGCKLGISRYPDFEYNANRGFGTGSGVDDSNGETLVSFDVDKLYILPLTSETTKFIGLPLPPLLRIDIVPEVFQGNIDRKTGKVDLEFKAKFWFSAGAIYKAPPLLVSTVLTTEESKGELRMGRGKRMDKDGNCKLVGVARVEPIDDAFMDTFLSLPTECLAVLNASISL